MNNDLLKSFVTVVESGDLQSAAKKLGKSKSTLSTTIKNLELDLGMELFNREGYRNVLNEKGKRVYYLALDLLQKNENFLSEVEALAIEDNVSLKIAIDYLTPKSVIFHITKVLKEAYPKAQIELSFEALSGVEERLMTYSFDFGISPFVIAPASFVTHKIMDLSVVPVVRKGLFEEGLDVRENLKKLRQISVKDSSRQERDLNFTGLSPHPWILTSDHPSKEQLILEGLGWGYLEKGSIEKELASGELLLIDSKVTPSKEVSLYAMQVKDRVQKKFDENIWKLLTTI